MEEVLRSEEGWEGDGCKKGTGASKTTCNEADYIHAKCASKSTVKQNHNFPINVLFKPSIFKTCPHVFSTD